LKRGCLDAEAANVESAQLMPKIGDNHSLVPLLEDKRLLITGVVTDRSIAFAIATRAQEEGAEVVLTSFGRARRITERVAKRLPKAADVLELDVNSHDDLEAVAGELEQRWGGLDGLVHAVAFAPEDALGGRFLSTPPTSAEEAFRTSALSLQRLAGGLAPLLETEPGGSVVGLDFDATVAWPGYDWMGVAKAALESISRYLARDLGPRGVRSNLISAGPLATLAARGIDGFERLAGAWERQAPLGWDLDDPGPVADAAVFLLSDLSRGVTGEILHVDGGYHALGAPLDPASTAESGRE
jgi:enoyl-[acyl-carrier protein] reductase I